MFSRDLLASWKRPVRFLFHDGSNQADEVRRDVAALEPYFVDGAIVAFHDVLNPSGSRAEVFVDEVLGSDNFGPVGFCGSIGWGQYFADPAVGVRYRPRKLGLQQKLASLVPFLGRPLTGSAKLRYKLLRSFIPHRRIGSARWLRAAA
jgi:hypothetical protein